MTNLLNASSEKLQNVKISIATDNFSSFDINYALIYKVGKFRRFSIAFTINGGCRSGSLINILYSDESTLSVTAAEYCGTHTFAIGAFESSVARIRVFDTTSDAYVGNGSNFVLQALTVTV